MHDTDISYMHPKKLPKTRTGRLHTTGTRGLPVHICEDHGHFEKGPIAGQLLSLM